MWGVAVASEGKMRSEAGKIVGENIAAELAPLSSATKDSTEIRPAPFVYIPNLWNKIQSVLEQKSKSTRYFHTCAQCHTLLEGYM